MILLEGGWKSVPLEDEVYICPSGCLILLLQNPSPNSHPYLEVGLFEPVFQPHPLDSFPS